MTFESKNTPHDAPRQLPRQLLVRLQNIAHRANRRPMTKPIARLIEIFIRMIWHAHLPPAARISPSVHFGHNGLGVILNPLCEIGANCLTGPHVVMGGRALIQGAPLLGKNITVHSGANSSAQYTLVMEV